MNDTKSPEDLEDDAVDAVQGGAETVFLPPTLNGEAVEGQSTAHAGLRSDGELVQAVSERSSEKMVIKDKKTH